MNRRKFVKNATLAAVGASVAGASLQAATGKNGLMYEVCKDTRKDMGSDPYGYTCKVFPDVIAELRSLGLNTKAIKDGFKKPEVLGDGNVRWKFYPA
jgi:hypothetical protein